ncbi:CUB domain-containing protein [Winogradskyella pulchriflava]|uniref:CUB domain-containing protein n=1 Tax=Winogradskyella pulchriflava TaxID=1110688 RepID=A0ABV6Q4W2_9FLAO
MIKRLLLILFCSYISFSFSQDDPCTALPLPLSPVGSCTYVMGDNTGATDSSSPNIDPPSGCEPVSANYNGADVWFYIDLGPTTTSINIDLTHIGTSSFNDGVAALYTGTCGGTLTIVECDDDSGDDSGTGSLEANFSVINALTPNTRVYIRVWDWGGNNEGTFNICASEIENPCDNITNISTCGTTPINATIASNFGAFNDSTCFDVPGDETIFSFTPTITGDYTITQISTFDHINYLYQTSCTPTGWTCIEDLTGNNETSGTFNMVAGTTYYIMLDSENSNGGDVDFTLNCPIPPPGCGDTFYDSGGPSGNYSNDESTTTTIFPDTAGDVVTTTFTFFDTEDTYDFLYIYDGPNNTFPLIGTYTGTNSPGTVTSSHASGALTFVFTCDGSVTDPGWVADITCAPYVPPTVCGSTFTDSGGAGGNYSNNQNITTTLTPDVPGTNLVATFTAFETEDTFDFLYIYDGPNNTFPLIGTYTGTNSPGTVTSSHASGALTFVFTSDGSVTDPGWVADITCVSTCNLIITDTNYPIGADDCNLNYTELTTNAPTPPPTNTIFSETFNAASFPAGWTIVNGGTGTIWTISNSSNAGGTAYEAQLDWSSAYENGTWSLTSPLIDITGQTNLQLNYRQELDHWSATYPYSVYVETSTDNTNWTIRYSSINVSNNISATMMNHDISSHDGNTSLYIRYRFAGESFGLLDWNIDNVEILADGAPSPPQVTWSPANGLYTDAALTTPYVLGNYAGTVYAAPNGTQVYNAEYPVGCTEDVTVTFNRKVWNGTPGNTDWNTATNWFPNGVPTATNCVYILDTGGNDPIIDGTSNGLGYNLTIEADATLTIDDDDTDTNYGSLTITDFIDLQGNSVLHILNNSSLIQINEGTANTNNNIGSGTLIMDRAPYVSNTDYVYWSSPVSDMSLSNIYGGDTPNATYQWIPTIDTGNTANPPPGPCNNINIPICDGDWEAYSGNMDIGKGYISNGPTSQGTTPTNYPTSIYGTLPNNGIITQTIESGINLSNNCPFSYIYPPTGNNLTVTPFDDNWNLIGNPYPSAISANAFINYDDGTRDNTLIEGAIHIWTHGTDASGINPDPFYDDFVLNYNPNDYLTYNLSGTNTYPNETSASDYYIASGQGFFVLADFDNGTNDVTFSNTMRNISHDNSTFYRRSNPNPVTTTNTLERHRIWLNLSDQNEQTSSTMVGYIEGATQAKDRSYDAYTFESNTMSIYSMIDNDRMVIQGRQLPFEIEDQVPLGVDILQTGNYIIAINGVDGLFEYQNQDIYLEDTYTNTIHDLRVSPYTFASDAGTFNDRFILRYTNVTLGIGELNPLNGIQVFEENEKIVVKSDHETIQSIEVYDILGRSLFTNKIVNSNRYSIGSLRPSNTTLFLKIRLIDGKEKVAKIIF